MLSRVLPVHMFDGYSLFVDTHRAWNTGDGVHARGTTIRYIGTNEFVGKS